MRVGRKASLVHAACCGFLIFGATSVSASPVDVGFPSDITATSNGVAAANGTRQVFYSLPSGSYTTLYFGFENIDVGQVGNLFTLPNPVVVSGLGTSTITETAHIAVTTLGGTVFAVATFTASLFGGLTWESASTVGITPGPLAVVDVTGLPGFTVDYALTVGGTPFNQWYNSLGNTLNIQSQSDITGDFQATPLPAALPLFATGLGGLGLLGWRRKRKAQAIA
jgi:hypothetical protein